MCASASPAAGVPRDAGSHPRRRRPRSGLDGAGGTPDLSMTPSHAPGCAAGRPAPRGGRGRTGRVIAACRRHRATLGSASAVRRRRRRRRPRTRSSASHDAHRRSASPSGSNCPVAPADALAGRAARPQSWERLDDVVGRDTDVARPLSSRPAPSSTPARPDLRAAHVGVRQHREMVPEQLVGTNPIGAPPVGPAASIADAAARYRPSPRDGN
jgi:hypothetical protein